MTWDTHPHAADGYLFLLKPTVVLAARVNLAAASYPTAEIPFDGVTTGAYTDVKIGQTVLIGSAAGGWDRGRIYVRDAATASVLKIGYCARGRDAGQVNLLDDSYITVLDTYENWARRGRMVDGVIYKDYDRVPLATPAPAAALGWAGGLVAAMDFVDAGTGLLAVPNLTAAGSSPMAAGATIAAQAWDMADGSYTSGDAASAAPDVTFAPGVRWISLVVTDSNGVASMARRALVIALEDSEDALLMLRVSQAHWRLTAEGVRFDCQLRQRLLPAEYPPGTVVVWLVQERRAGAASNLTGYQVKFAGWLDTQRSFGQARRTGWERTATIYAVDAAQRHQQLRAFPSTMARAAAVENHNQMADATLDRYLWWYLYWHTFWPSFADWSGSGDATHPFMSFSSPGGDFYAVGDHLARAMAHRLTSDSRGRALIKPDPLRLEAEARTSTVLRAITPADISQVERLTHAQPRRGVTRATYVLASVTNAADQVGEWPELYVKAPGDVEGQSLGEQQIGYPQIAASAVEAQARVGQDHQRANAAEEPLRIGLAHGGDAGLEPALMAWVTLSTDEETVGWLDEPLSAERCLLTAVEYRYDDQANAMGCAIEVERETQGTAGTDDAIAGENTPSNPDAANPTRLLLVAGQNKIAAITRLGYLLRTGNFTAASPTWAETNLGIGSFDDVLQSPFELTTALAVGTDQIFRVTSIGGTAVPSAVFTFRASLGFNSRAIQYERGLPGFAVVASGYSDGVYVTHTLDDGLTWSAEIRVGAAVSVGNVIYSRPGLEINSHSAAVYVEAHNGTTWSLYKSTDLAVSFSEAADFAANPINAYLRTVLHMSWADADTLYSVGRSGYSQPGNGDDEDVRVVKLTATSAETLLIRWRITGFSDYAGPELARWGMRSYDGDANKLLIAVQQPKTGGYRYGLYRSLDAGTTIDAVVDSAATSGDLYRGCAIGGDGVAVYVWGNRNGSPGIWYAEPFASFAAGDLQAKTVPDPLTPDFVLNIFGLP